MHKAPKTARTPPPQGGADTPSPEDDADNPSEENVSETADWVNRQPIQGELTRAAAMNSRRGFKAAFTRVLNLMKYDIGSLDNDTRERTTAVYNQNNAIFRNLENLLQNLERKFESLEQNHMTILSTYDHEDETWENAGDIEKEFKELTNVKKAIYHLEGQWTGNRAERDDISQGSNRSGKSMKEFAALLGIQYDAAKEVTTFNGKDILTYISFKSQWERAEKRLVEIGKGEIQLLQELKRVLSGQALDLVKLLPETKGNYKTALAQLSAVYEDPNQMVRHVVDQLLDIKPLEDTQESLMTGYGLMQQALQTFEGLSMTAEDMSTVFFTTLCERKLSEQSKRAWRKQLQNKADPSCAIGTRATKKDFLQIILNQAKLCRKGAKTQGANEEKKRGFNQWQQKRAQGTAPATFLSSQPKKGCVFCNNQNHPSIDCRKLPRMNRAEIITTVKENQLCFACFEPFDRQHLRKCKAPKCPAENCTKKHSKWIHQDQKTVAIQQECEEEDDGEEEEENPMVAITANKGGRYRGILRTCLAYLINPKSGQKTKARFLLDAAAEQNLVRRKCAQILELDGPKQQLQMNVAGGGCSKTTQEKEIQFQIGSLDNSYVTEVVTGTTIKNIAQPAKAVLFAPKDYSHLKGLPFTEAYPSKQDMVLDVLIGEPLFTHLCVGTAVSNTMQEPAAQNTRLGWVLCGAHPKADSKRSAVNYTVLHAATKQPDISDFWRMEHMGIVPKDNALTVEEEDSLKLMEKVSEYDAEARRWSTKLLWKEEPKQELANNYTRAICVMNSVEKRTKVEDRELLNSAYQAFEKDEFAEKVPPCERMPTDGRFVYHLETHPVYKRERVSTKCRIVMNAASKDKRTKKSLNDLLYTGPNLLPEIAQIQMRFRLRQHGIVLDISKMFLQIQLHGNDKDALRYVWRNFDMKATADIFRMKTLTFGLNSSPFQAIWCLLQTAEKHKHLLPGAAREVMTNIYMDDLVSSADSIKGARDLLDKVIELLSLGGFKAHKFATNSPEVLEGFQPDQCQTGIVSTLGLQWDTGQDLIKFNFMKKVDQIQSTKRGVLKAAASLYDPLGLISPFTMQAKLIMRRLWEEEMAWDESLPNELQTQWEKWKAQLPILEKIKTPRWLHGSSTDEAFLASFGDASKEAYGAAVYFVTISQAKKSVTASLIFSKARLAPQDKPAKTLSIARLELLGAVCAARAGEYAATALGIPPNKCYFFTDSLITLLRIQQGPQKWRQWVGNRIKVIESITNKAQWRFCPGEDNPADLPSRGADVETLLASSLWWGGPAFLKQSQEHWPKQKTMKRTKEMLEIDVREEKKIIHNLVVSTKDHSAIDELLEKQSRWLKLTRITAWILRFKGNLLERVRDNGSQQETNSKRSKKKVKENPLTVVELQKAEQFWLQKAQREEFQEEIRNLEQGLEVEKNSKILQFQPLWREDKIVSSSRLRDSEKLPDKTRYPMILPKHSKIIEMYVLHLHELFLHCGAEQLLAFLRRQYMPLGGRREIKRIIHQCKAMKCRRIVPLTQRMSALPSERTETSPVCFETTGLDFFGPMFVKHVCEETNCPHDRDAKVYGCLFTCFSSRAIHIELLSDLSTESFLMSLRRFTSRRGMPTTLYSDNAKTFKSADKELRKIQKSIDWTKVMNASTAKAIQWKYSIERAPWTNGVTERMIGTVKRSLRIALHATKLTEVQLATLLSECEAIVNNRPLTTVKEGEALLPITPAQLCTGRELLLIPQPRNPKTEEEQPKFLEKWRHRKTLLNSFWKRWRNDYLLNLAPTKKWKQRNEQTLNSGDVVLLKEDNLGKNEWKLARVEEVHEGRDGLQRSANLRLPTGSKIYRHFNKIALLEEDMRVQPPAQQKR